MRQISEVAEAILTSGLIEPTSGGCDDFRMTSSPKNEALVRYKVTVLRLASLMSKFSPLSKSKCFYIVSCIFQSRKKIICVL